MNLIENILPEQAAAPKGFRFLKGREIVSPGDFVEDKQGKLELWEGPRGFRADAFIKPIYRRSRAAATVAKIQD